METAYTKEESWLSYLTNVFKKEDEPILPETPNIITDEKTEITEKIVKQGIES